VDVFIYFAHALVALPTATWINAGHTNGVPVLGTFLTEHKEGLEAGQVLFSDRDTAGRAATQLTAMARFWGFDGWLVRSAIPLSTLEVNGHTCVYKHAACVPAVDRAQVGVTVPWARSIGAFVYGRLTLHRCDQTNGDRF
jgi:hypothetical protein